MIYNVLTSTMMIVLYFMTIYVGGFALAGSRFHEDPQVGAIWGGLIGAFTCPGYAILTSSEWLSRQAGSKYTLDS